MGMVGRLETSRTIASYDLGQLAKGHLVQEHRLMPSKIKTVENMYDKSGENFSPVESQRWRILC